MSDEQRATFILSKVHLGAVKTLSKYRRCSQKELMADMLDAYFKKHAKEMDRADKLCGGRGLWPIRNTEQAQLAVVPEQAALAKQVETAAVAARRSTWEAYAQAYAERVGQMPVRNAKSSALIKQFVERIGQEESPEVIRFFVHHPDGRYISRLYMLELAVKDAESLRTQWANHKPFTKQDIRQFETSHARQDVRARIARGEV